MISPADERLEYVKIVADHFCPHIEYDYDEEGHYSEQMEESYAPFTFATRLNNGCVSEAVKPSRYDSNEELQKMIPETGFFTAPNHVRFVATKR